MNRKAISLILSIFTVLSCTGCGAGLVAGMPEAVSSAEHTRQVATAATPSKAAAESPTASAAPSASIAETPSATTVSPSPTAAPAPAPAATTAPTATTIAAPTAKPTPTPYTEEWIKRYAPASCASYKAKVGSGTVSKVASYPAVGTYRLVMDYTNQCVRAYSKDSSGKYTVLERVMICSSGGNGNWTPTGVFKMGDSRVRFGEFKKLGGFAQYWSQIQGSFYFHSVLYSKRSVSSLEKSSYNNLGRACSHGCVRLLVPDAQWIWENCAPGTECEVTTAFKRDKLLRAVLKKGLSAAAVAKGSKK